MKQVQQSLPPPQQVSGQAQQTQHLQDVQHTFAQRLLRSILIGVVCTLLLTLLTIAVVVLLNPFGVVGKVGTFPLRFSATLALPSSAPATLLLPAGELLLFSLLAFFGARPFALWRYLRAAHQAQQEYSAIYTPLMALPTIRQTAALYLDEDETPLLDSQEQRVSLLDLIGQQDTHQLILGVPGAGKTMALRMFQYNASQNPQGSLFSNARIPVYIPMKNYSLFLKKYHGSLSAQEAEEGAQGLLFSYLVQSDLPGMRYLGAHLAQLLQQGRLLLLCDGLNEIDSNYLAQVSEELVELMRTTSNRLVMTCREVDYREQPDFVALVSAGQATCVTIFPLQAEQVYQFVERYVEEQSGQWRHTAGQIIQVIDRSRLRYHCTNPMMLYTLMEIIDKIGVERGKQIDTRGRLLREYVTQLLLREQSQPRWSRGAPDEESMVTFLSEVASAARWAHDRNAIGLRISSSSSSPEELHGKLNFAELADELQFWLDEHPAQGPFALPETEMERSAHDMQLLLQFALSAGLIDISPGGVLSFRHELIAEYFVAEYFFAVSPRNLSSAPAIREELLDDVGRWSEPIAIWAGLLDHPDTLAERFAQLGLENRAYILPALALGLICIGVLWTPPQAEVQHPVVLPTSMEEALAYAVRNRAAREELARIFTRCAEEGGQEVYRSLLPLITVEGIDDLLVLLDQNVVPELLFTHLQDAVDNIAFETQVRRLTRVLGRFGPVVVERAAQLSLPAPERSSRLRAAVINVLGGSNDARAVEPLLARLRDAEQVIVERATNALIRLGPTLTLTRLLQELEQHSNDPLTPRVHHAVLLVLGRFLDERDPQRQLSSLQYQHVLERVLPVLTSNYAAEPEVQQQAQGLLIRQGRASEETGTQNRRWEMVITMLLSYLPMQNEGTGRNVVHVLQEIGKPAVPYLLDLLNAPSDLVRIRVVEVLKVSPDERALEPLLHRIDDPAPAVAQQVSEALRIYAPDSIPGLLQHVVHGESVAVAERAARILTSIGESAVEPILHVLFDALPERALLLVQVLELLRDSRALPALMLLLQQEQSSPLLSVTLIRTLGQFREERVVLSLLSVLSASNPLIYEEAVTALSQLGDVALPELLQALDTQQNATLLQRIRRAILGMTPFPGERLIEAWEGSSRQLGEQVMLILTQQGSDAAYALVQQMLHPDEQVRGYIAQAIERTPGAVIVPPLLESLYAASMRRAASNFLLRFPDEAIPLLVGLLGERERGESAAVLLPQFGPVILRPLLEAFEEQNSTAREQAQRVMLTLVQQSGQPQEIVREIMQLFTPTPPARTRESLISLLSVELADISIPVLLEGLEDARLLEEVAETFTRLAGKPAYQSAVLDNLLSALYTEERRSGAELTLVRIGKEIGGAVVVRVGELITEQNPLVASAAKRILRDIGVNALPFIWTAQSDRHNPARRTAAVEIFRSMPSDVVKDELVALLVGDSRDDIAMAVSLLLERIHDETRQGYTKQVMVPELIEYVQTHSVESTNLRIIALLLLLGEQAVHEHLLQALDEFPQHGKQLVYLLLLFSDKTHRLLLDVFKDPDTSPELRADLASILTMGTQEKAPDEVVQYAQNTHKYGLTKSLSTILMPEKLTLSLRALGGLLASGSWHTRKLLQLRDASDSNDANRELYNVLLGWRYTPQITMLENDLKTQSETFKTELVALTGRIVAEQQRAQGLEEELEKIRLEHGFRGDELKQALQERDSLRVNLDKQTRENNTLRASLEHITKERNTLNTLLDRTRKEYQEYQQSQGQQGQQGQQSGTKSK